VKSASKKEVGFPSAELMGSESNTAPINIAIKKLNKIICVVDTRGLCFFINSSYTLILLCKNKMEPNFSADSWFHLHLLF